MKKFNQGKYLIDLKELNGLNIEEFKAVDDYMMPSKIIFWK